MKRFFGREENIPEEENLLEEVWEDLRDKEITEIEAAAERLEAYERVRWRKRRRNLFRGAGITAILLILTFGVIYLGYRLLFRVNEFAVIGDTPYTNEEIIDGIGVEYGTPIFSFRESAVRENLIRKLPLVTDLQVDRQAPGKVTLYVTCEEPVYFTWIYGKIYLLSESLRLLGESDGDTTGLVKLCLPTVKIAEMGQVPVFADKDAGERLSLITKAVQNSSLSDCIGKVDLRDPFSLSMVCDAKYLLEFGEYTEVDTKLSIAKAVLEDEMFRTENKARINLSNLSETSVVIDNRLVLD